MNQGNKNWTFLSNHAHVLICLSRDPHQTLRQVSLQVGITERAAKSRHRRALQRLLRAIGNDAV